MESGRSAQVRWMPGFGNRLPKLNLVSRGSYGGFSI